jgi:hypothetical protein
VYTTHFDFLPEEWLVKFWQERGDGDKCTCNILSTECMNSDELIEWFSQYKDNLKLRSDKLFSEILSY